MTHVQVIENSILALNDYLNAELTEDEIFSLMYQNIISEEVVNYCLERLEEGISLDEIYEAEVLPLIER